MERKIESEARDPRQGTDELIVETGISTFPCRWCRPPPCHDTELENKRWGGGQRKIERGSLTGHTGGETHTVHTPDSGELSQEKGKIQLSSWRNAGLCGLERFHLLFMVLSCPAHTHTHTHTHNRSEHSKQKQPPRTFLQACTKWNCWQSHGPEQ